MVQLGELSAHQALDVRHSHKNVRMRNLEPDTQFQLDEAGEGGTPTTSSRTRRLCAGGAGMGGHDSSGFVGPNPWCPRRSGSVVVAVA